MCGLKRRIKFIEISILSIIVDHVIVRRLVITCPLRDFAYHQLEITAFERATRYDWW